MASRSIVISLLFAFSLGLPYLALAHGNGNDGCHRHVIEMAGLVKEYYKVIFDINAANNELEVLNHNESRTDEENARVTELENAIKNLRKKLNVHLDALNSKSERVIAHCTE